MCDTWLDEQKGSIGLGGRTLFEEDQLLSIDIRCHNTTWKKGIGSRGLSNHLIRNYIHIFSLAGDNWSENPWKLKGVEENIPYHLGWPTTVKAKGGVHFVNILHSIEEKELHPS